MMTNPNPHAESVRIKPPGAALLLLVAALAALFVVMAALAGPAQAETLTVTNTNDSGPGSLRAAIDSAAPIGDTITFASNVSGTITLTGGGLEIGKNLTIEGPGAGKLAVSGNNRYTVFNIDYGNTVRISGLTITKGYADNYYGGGGIYNYGNLTLTKSVVRGNAADSYSEGGGIYNNNVLTLNESVVRDNAVGGEGGGISNYYGTLTVNGSTISGNTAGGYGGGGIYSLTSSPEKTTIINSTISGNSATSADGAGGGIYNALGLTDIKYSTIKNNKAPRGQGSGVASYGDNYRVTTKVFSSIIAGNKSTDVDRVSSSDNTFTSNGYNLIGDGNATGAFNKTGDQVGVTNPGRVITGTPGNDTLRGTSGSDIISGLGGNDSISGLGGGDIISGLGGNDTIYGGAGNDRLFGGTGVDKLYGGPSADFLNVRDSKPKDLAVGGGGTDTCRTDTGDTRRSCEK